MGADCPTAVPQTCAIMMDKNSWAKLGGQTPWLTALVIALVGQYFRGGQRWGLSCYNKLLYCTD